MKRRQKGARDFAPAVLLGALILLFAPACQTSKRASPSGSVRPPIVSEEFLPTTTPFDGSAEAKAEYLEAYRNGYHDGAGWLIPLIPAPVGVRVGDRVDLSHPRLRGWIDGAWAARLHAARNLRQETAKE